MVKKLLWMIILVLATAFSVVVGDVEGAFDLFNPSPTAMVTPAVTLTDLPATETLQATDFPATATPEATLEFTPTESLPPTQTSQPATPTFTPLPTATATALPTPTATLVPYQVQRMTPVFMTNFVHTEAGCNWQGVAGQVFDGKGVPVLNYIVKITGTYNNQPVNLLGITGMVTGLPYGPGSYEIVLGSSPVDSLDSLNIQLFNDKGDPVTDPLTFSTSKECSKNLVLINFLHK